MCAHAGTCRSECREHTVLIEPKELFFLIKDCCVCPTNIAIIIKERVCWKFSNIRNNEKLNFVKTNVAVWAEVKWFVLSWFHHHVPTFVLEEETFVCNN